MVLAAVERLLDVEPAGDGRVDLAQGLDPGGGFVTAVLIARFQEQADRVLGDPVPDLG